MNNEKTIIMTGFFFTFNEITNKIFHCVNNFFMFCDLLHISPASLTRHSFLKFNIVFKYLT